MKRMLAVFLLISFVGCGTLMGTVKISPLSQDSYSEIVLAEDLISKAGLAGQIFIIPTGTYKAVFADVSGKGIFYMSEEEAIVIPGSGGMVKTDSGVFKGGFYIHPNKKSVSIFSVQDSTKNSDEFQGLLVGAIKSTYKHEQPMLVRQISQNLAKKIINY